MSVRARGTWGRRGQAAVEFALILPFLLVMLVGIIEFGRAWNEHQVITDAAREAARKGAIFDETITLDSVINTAVASMTAAGINPARCDDCIAAPGWDLPGGQPLTVTIELPYTFTFFGPLVKWSTGQSNITLRTSFTMRNE
jgi:Flp pilus assembly protein TadG